MKLTDFVVCDDIRREVSNKHTLVGIYDDLVVQRAPGVPLQTALGVKLGFFVRFRTEPTDTILPDAFHVRFLVGDRELAVSKGVITAKTPVNTLQLALVFNVFLIPQGTERIDFEVVLAAGEKVLGKWRPDPLRVRFADAPSSPQ
jgi:hypothetical protein